MDERIRREADYHNKAFGQDIRKKVKKYYETARISKDRYENAVIEYGKSSRVLEYGCGPGSQAFKLADSGAEVTAIDISEVAIEKARKEAVQQNLSIDFRVMNAEQLEFPSETFDLICGSGILHHLNLERTYSEITRVLKKGGVGIFYEPLGHNPIINFYRKMTPNLRTKDEHPILYKDLSRAEEFFEKIEVEYYHLFSFFISFLKAGKLKRYFLDKLNKLDHILIKNFTFLRRYSWICIVFVKK